MTKKTESVTYSKEALKKVFKREDDSWMDGGEEFAASLDVLTGESDAISLAALLTMKEDNYIRALVAALACETSHKRHDNQITYNTINLTSDVRNKLQIHLMIDKARSESLRNFITNIHLAQEPKGTDVETLRTQALDKFVHATKNGQAAAVANIAIGYKELFAKDRVDDRRASFLGGLLKKQSFIIRIILGVDLKSSSSVDKAIAKLRNPTLIHKLLFFLLLHGNRSEAMKNCPEPYTPPEAQPARGSSPYANPNLAGKDGEQLAKVQKPAAPSRKPASNEQPEPTNEPRGPAPT